MNSGPFRVARCSRSHDAVEVWNGGVRDLTEVAKKPSEAKVTIS